jgi:V/A-type H+-transporting ATPase subunit D
MAIVFQYNNASMLHLRQQVEMREKALPVLKSKESALRSEVKKTKLMLQLANQELSLVMREKDEYTLLGGELDVSLISVDHVEIEVLSIAGVKVPDVSKIHFKRKMYNAFINPFWFGRGIDFIEKTTILMTKMLFLEKRILLLENARKKTTQKVNLYEKNQIPEFRDAISKIKRFLEDEENLSKSAQKILKSKLESETTL